MPDRPRYVTTGQAARLLGVSQRALQQWISDGLIVPDFYTPKGHARLDVERVRRELREKLRREDDDG